MRRIGLVDAASLRMADRELLDLLVDLTRSQVRDARTAGVIMSSLPERAQVLAILRRRIGPHTSVR